jgi:hypothetical protein
LAFLFLELQEFATPGSCKKLFCDGRLCAKCHKCRDWHFSGNEHMWHWVSIWQNWNEADKDCWHYSYDKLLTKRDDATCDGRHAFDGGAGLGRMLGGDASLGRIIAGAGLARGDLDRSGFGRGFGGSLIFNTVR